MADETKTKVAADIAKLRDVFQEAKKDYEDDPSIFHSTKIFKMMRFLKLYSVFMEHLGAKLNEDAMAELYDLDEELYDSINSLRKEWDEFLDKIENKVDTNNEPMDLVSIAGSNEQFTNVSTNQITSLHDLHMNFRTQSGITTESKSYVHLVMLRHFA